MDELNKELCSSKKNKKYIYKKKSYVKKVTHAKLNKKGIVKKE